MITSAWKSFWRQFGFFAERAILPGNLDWAEDRFFSAHKAKTERLAAIARERSALKDKLQKAISQKKERGSIYNALRALSSEELRLEQGK